ncbi:TonB-dependent receptor [Chitinophaga arvensicola]|uniref:TonB-linked outer membrane protein, SusC/RagA family n=1 Tax=Chitinophaga arvensicola TaxID=29529 RepID=A0A1I0SCT0_9BACT|nr:TonB-dependent receptor [Chitinophaga arvensicola]SEW55161.1 TonB-linked outer membrane protein, SusC/RagA family [Chitinophaga arvensicola]
MKLKMFLTIAVFLLASAIAFSQDKITLSGSNIPLEKIFKSIHKQSGYNFLYNDRVLSNVSPVSINVKDAMLDDVLQLCLKDLPLSYDIINKTVVIKARNGALPPAPAVQGITVTGIVRDTTGVPLERVNVQVKGTTTGITTDAKGRFSLHVPNKQATLQFSYLGYLPQEIVAGDRTALDVRLHVQINSLTDVVVVGYGQTQTRNRLTGAVSFISSEEIVTTKNENVINMLTGKLPGMRILQKSSEPGAYDNVFDIRGMGSPLVVIDGVPRSGGDLSRMDPNEIDNISVLKDATAAIYGVRAANGVILVTSKKGSSAQSGKFDITYAVNQSWQQFLNAPHGVNATEYMMLKNEQTKRDFGKNFFIMRPPAFAAADMELYRNGTLKSSDWVGATMRDFAPETQHTLSFNGGSERINYFFNLGYFKQDGMFKSGDMNYDRFNFRSNINAKITDRLRVALLTSGYMDTKNQPGGRGVWEMFKYTWNQLPTDQIYANNNPAYPHVITDNANPVVITNSDIVGYQSYKNKNFQGQLALDYDVPGIRGLTARGMYNYGFNIGDNTMVNKAFKLYTYDPQNDTYKVTPVASPSTVNRSYWNNTSTLFQLSLNYNRRIHEVHNITALLLYEESNSKVDNFSAQREFSLGIPYLFAGDLNNQQGNMDGNGLGQIVTKGIVGRVGYDYKGKYIVDISFRQDGSSKFVNSHQWGFFPAAAVGWRLSEEQFIQHLISPHILGNLKLRASYGKTGDDAATAFQSFPGYDYPRDGYIMGGTFVNGLGSRGIVNPDLTWSTAKTLNAGLDAELYRGLLGLSVDYFVRNRDGLPDTRTTSLPGTVGARLPQENLRSDRTRGMEVALTHRNHIGELAYHVSANIASTRTILVHREETRAGNSYENWKNSQQNRYTNIWWGREYAGQFTSYDQIYNHSVNTGGGNQNVVPGDYYYKDLNHDGVVDNKDEVPIATRDIPMVNYGVAVGAAWRGIDFNILLQGATQFYVQYAEQMASPLMYEQSALVQFLDRWHTADPNADVFDPNTKWIPGYYPSMGSPDATGTKAVQNASYLRIKTLEIGYSFPKKWLKKAGISNARMYVNSYNLGTFTALKNSDPEHPGEVQDPKNGDQWNYSQGGYKYPMNRTYSIGASVTF